MDKNVEHISSVRIPNIAFNIISDQPCIMAHYVVEAIIDQAYD